MRIAPLPNALNPANFDDNPNAVALTEAINEIENLFDDYFNPGIEDNSGYCKECSKRKCLLEFFYYYDSLLDHIPAYKNGIWIRINEDNERWLFVLVNTKSRKKVSITTRNNLHCLPFPQQLSRYKQLPPDFNGPFAWYEKINVIDMTYCDLMNEIINRLSCIC